MSCQPRYGWIGLTQWSAGSPLGIFLTLRRVNPNKGRGLGTPVAAKLMPGAAAEAGDGLPAVRRMYNLYHPFDPVGFRHVHPNPLSSVHFIEWPLTV